MDSAHHAIGLFTSIFVVATYTMRTMIPLRIFGIITNVLLITYSLPTHAYATALLHGILLPLNVYRLHEMLKLVKQVEAASRGDMSLDWLKPFMTERVITVGETLFRKGEKANHLYFLVSGQLHLQEINVDLAPGAVVETKVAPWPPWLRTSSTSAPRGSVCCCSANGAALPAARSTLNRSTSRSVLRQGMSPLR